MATSATQQGARRSREGRLLPPASSVNTRLRPPRPLPPPACPPPTPLPQAGPGRRRPRRRGLPEPSVRPAPPPLPTARSHLPAAPEGRARSQMLCVTPDNGESPRTEIPDPEPKSHGKTRSAARARRSATETAERSPGPAGRYRASRAPLRLSFTPTGGGERGGRRGWKPLPREGCPADRDLLRAGAHRRHGAPTLGAAAAQSPGHRGQPSGGSRGVQDSVKGRVPTGMTDRAAPQESRFGHQHFRSLNTR